MMVCMLTLQVVNFLHIEYRAGQNRGRLIQLQVRAEQNRDDIEQLGERMEQLEHKK